MNKFFNIVLSAAAAVLLGVFSIDGSYAQVIGNGNGFGNTTSASQSLAGSSSTGVAAGNKTDVTVQAAPIPTDTTVNLKNVPNVTSPGLTTTLTETCMGSWSVGGAVSGFGLGGGKTEVDTRCANRLDARELKTWGDAEVAKEVMCGTPEVRAAYKRVGRPCMDDQKVAVAPAATEPKKVGTGVKDSFVKSSQ